MNQEEFLKKKYGNKLSMKVPEGYFESVYKEIQDKLPEYPEAPKFVEMTMWQKIKPYAYLAAMFAGIWLMMKTFHTASQNATLNLDNPPAQIAMAMNDSEMSKEFLLPDESSYDFELENELSSQYSNIEEFERDFGYKFKDQYDNIKID